MLSLSEKCKVQVKGGSERARETTRQQTTGVSARRPYRDHEIRLVAENKTV